MVMVKTVTVRIIRMVIVRKETVESIFTGTGNLGRIQELA